MKRILGCLMIVMAFSLGACASDEDSGTVYEVVDTEDGNMSFMPTDLVIAVGDTVRFKMTATHNAVEVTKETYDALDITAKADGFEVDYGKTQEITFNKAGVYYYVCQPHVKLKMIGTITVQ
ncbi:MAG TPA: hypothetical protein DCQ06_01175 [Myxococcales bacterium]|nr:hypothetical protein [Myxococcales bacterium]